MAKPYTINITNGTGTGNILNGSYNVTAEVQGYLNNSIDPSTLMVVDGTNEYSLKIAAEGTLTLHVTEDGTAAGTSIVGATFIRTDASGIEYGDPITTDTNGNAVFYNVPFAATGAPVIYYKQTASDGEHEFDDSVKNITMTTATETVEITNLPPAPRTITLTDANYDNLPIAAGTITLN